MSASTVLTDNRIRLRNATPGNHKTTCPECSWTRRKKTDPCLSVTIEADDRVVWNCHHCGWSGAGGSDREGYRPRVERKVYRKPVREANPQRPDATIAYFAARGISAAVVERMGIYRTRRWFPQLDAEADCIAFPYEWAGELRNVKYRTKDKHFVQEKDPEPVFYNADSIAAGEDLIIAEGEMDVLSFLEAGFEHVVSLPNGAPNSENEPSDKRYEPFGTHWEMVVAAARILIATDMDENGELLAQEIARRVGKDRCWRVRMPTSGDVPIKDANECLTNHGGQVLRECVSAAEPWPIDGLHHADEFRGRVLDLYHGRGPKPMTTGFPEMDYAFKYVPGQFIVVTGIPNHGKSRWLDQVAINSAMERDERWAIFSPETIAEQHIADLSEIWAGVPFFQGPSYRMDEYDVERAVEWINERFFFIVANDHTPSADWIIARARASVVRYGVRHLIVDPYNEVEASRPTSQTETEFISQLISKFKLFARQHDVVVWMVIHPTKLQNTQDGREAVPGLYDIAGSAHWRNKADAALVVYRDYSADETFVMSKKIRRQPMCGIPGSVTFKFNGSTRRFSDQDGSFRTLGTKGRGP